MKFSSTSKKLVATAACLGLSTIGLSACGMISDPSVPSVTGSYGEAPTIAKGEPGKEPKELKVATLKSGSGEVCGDNAVVRANYTGQLWNGKVFDSSFEREKANKGQDASIAFSLDGVIKGWKQGLKDAQPGSRVELVIPPSLGYGQQASQQIPANSTLVFVVDVLDCFSNKQISAGLADLKKAKPTDKTISGVEISGALGAEPKIKVTDEKALPAKEEQVVLAEGNGPKANAGDFLIYHITPYYVGSSQQQPSSWARGAEHVLSTGAALSGEKELLGQKVGSRTVVFFPKKGEHPATVIVVDIVGVMKGGKK